MAFSRRMRRRRRDPPRTLCNRFIRWTRPGVFNSIFASLAARGGKPDRLMIAAPPSEGTPHGGGPARKGVLPRRIGRTRGGLNSRLHAVCDGKGRPPVMLPGEGQRSGYKGAALMPDALPGAKALPGDRGHDAGMPGCRLVPRRSGRAQHHRLHPVRVWPQGTDPARGCPLPPAPQDRDHVRQAQGPAAYPHPP